MIEVRLVSLTLPHCLQALVGSAGEFLILTKLGSWNVVHTTDKHGVFKDGVGNVIDYTAIDRIYALPAVPAKKRFEIHLQYYKDNGKFYTEASGTMLCKMVVGDGCYMQDAVDELEALRRDNKPLPGLCTAGRDFFIVLSCEQGHPVLLKPYKGVCDGSMDAAGTPAS